VREKAGIKPVYKLVDTCAAEFESFTPYFYSCYDEEDEATPTANKKIIILGSGPNRIGQGIEFDYCCCHAAFALREDGYETIMVNCNPETVSTDYDTSDRLYFEPLTYEDVLAVYKHEASSGADIGMIVQFGGQTPLNLSLPLKAAGVPIIGTSPESIELAEDRKRFQKLIEDLKIPQPAGVIATSIEQALAGANKVTYPVLVRPSFVLGGRAMVIAYDDEAIVRYMNTAIEYSQERPVLIDHFLEDATEVDVDALCDSKDVIIAGIMQHIEEAGIHSGDSSCVLPAVDLSADVLDQIRRYTRQLALSLNVIGLVNIQFAIQHGKVYVIEVNPRASRTVPYVSKATGIPLASFCRRNSLPARTSARARITSSSRLSSRGASSRASIRFSDRRCVPPAKSWAWPKPSVKPLPRRRSPLARTCPPRARSSSVSTITTRRMSSRWPSSSSRWASTSSQRTAQPTSSAMRASR
jgi:carbamoyl-phosphate synthase large subunit